MFLNSFNHFRAIAIAFIVAAHCYDVAGVTFNTLGEYIVRNLTAGGTALFVFISGFMFHHVFYNKFDFQRFIVGKIKNILIPYTVLSVLPISLYIYLHKPLFDGYFLPQGVGLINEYIIPALKYYWTGRFMTAYWYIPYIMLTFLLSPLHVLFIKLNVKKQIMITVMLLVGATLLHRPIENVHVVQSVLYFTPVYLLGILCSINRDHIYTRLSGKEGYLFVIVIALAVIQAVMGDYGNYHKNAFDYGGFDILIFQKTILCIFFMVWLKRFEDLNLKYAQLLASTSFAVFFLHPYLLRILNTIITSSGFQIPAPWIVFFLLILIILVACVFIALITKRFLPRYSRYLIGY